MEEWRTCFEDFRTDLGANFSPEKATDAAIGQLMSIPELERAQVAMSKVYMAAIEKANTQAAEVISDRKVWYDRTMRYQTALAKVTTCDPEKHASLFNLPGVHY